MTAPNDGVRPARGWWIAAWVLCAVGAAARVATYAQNRSLWYDEAALALNIAERGFIALLAPLDYLQTAPPLFLWVQRLVTLAFGSTEWALRAVPLLAGVFTPVLTARVGRRLFSEPVALLAVALVALAPTLVRYAAEAKPYATDAAVTLVVLDRALAVRGTTSSAREWWTLAITGAVALLASIPSAFVLGGVVAYLLATAGLARDRRGLKRALALGAGWAAAFAVLLATIFRPLIGETSPIGKFMHWYWAVNFLTPEPPGIVTKVLALLWSALPNTFLGEGAIPNATTLFLGTAVVGLVVLVARRQIPTVLLLTVPIAALALASMLRLYPIAERLILFAAPLSALLLAAAALVVAGPRTRNAGSVVVTAATLAVVVLAGRGVLAQLRSDLGRQESRAFAREAGRRHAAGAPVWISGGAEAAWRFYAGTPPGTRRSNDEQLAGVGGRVLAPDLIVGEWYSAPPERILNVVDDTTAMAKPSAWSETEAGRVNAVARPCALVFLTHMQPGEAQALLASVEGRGGRVVKSQRAPGAELHDVCFATDTPATSAPPSR